MVLLKVELKKKDELIGLINKQLIFIPKLMTDLKKKTDELKSSEKEKEKLKEEVKRLNLVKVNGTTKMSLEGKLAREKLKKEVEAQKEEIRKLKEDFAKVNPVVKCSD